MLEFDISEWLMATNDDCFYAYITPKNIKSVLFSVKITHPYGQEHMRAKLEKEGIEDFADKIRRLHLELKNLLG